MDKQRALQMEVMNHEISGEDESRLSLHVKLPELPDFSQSAAHGCCVV